MSVARKSMSETGPVVKVHLQQHPEEDRHVTVIILEDYSSQAYMESIQDRVRGLKFQTLKHNSGPFMRLATEIPADHKLRDVPIPLTSVVAWYTISYSFMLPCISSGIGTSLSL